MSMRVKRLCCRRRIPSAQLRRTSSKSGQSVPVRTSFATARAQTRRLLCLTPSRHAKTNGFNVLILDTAGRLHNKANLVNELAKIDRVISRELPDASRETLLVLDATTGQNAVHQAEEFNKAAELTGIILTKLDGTAKGGIVIAISAGLGVPVKLVGVGEGIDDLIDFDRAAFLEAILPPVHENAENDEEQTEEDENAET